MTPSQQPEQAIFIEKCRLFGELFEARRLEDLVAMFYTSDAILEGQGLAPQQGRAEILRIYEDARAFCHSINIYVGPVTIVGDVAYGCVTNTNCDTEGNIQTHRGMLVWRRVAQEWLVAHDFFFCDADQALLTGWSTQSSEFAVLSQRLAGI